MLLPDRIREIFGGICVVPNSVLNRVNSIEDRRCYNSSMLVIPKSEKGVIFTQTFYDPLMQELNQNHSGIFMNKILIHKLSNSSQCFDTEGELEKTSDEEMLSYSSQKERWKITASVQIAKDCVKRWVAILTQSFQEFYLVQSSDSLRYRSDKFFLREVINKILKSSFSDEYVTYKSIFSKKSSSAADYGTGSTENSGELLGGNSVKSSQYIDIDNQNNKILINVGDHGVQGHYPLKFVSAFGMITASIIDGYTSVIYINDNVLNIPGFEVAHYFENEVIRTITHLGAGLLGSLAFPGDPAPHLTRVSIPIFSTISYSLKAQIAKAVKYAKINMIGEEQPKTNLLLNSFTDCALTAIAGGVIGASAATVKWFMIPGVGKIIIGYEAFVGFTMAGLQCYSGYQNLDKEEKNGMYASYLGDSLVFINSLRGGFSFATYKATMISAAKISTILSSLVTSDIIFKVILGSMPETSRYMDDLILHTLNTTTGAGKHAANYMSDFIDGFEFSGSLVWSQNHDFYQEEGTLDDHQNYDL